jgi:hypothetical protein
VVPEEDCN